MILFTYLTTLTLYLQLPIIIGIFSRSADVKNIKIKIIISKSDGARSENRLDTRYAKRAQNRYSSGSIIQRLTTKRKLSSAASQ